MHYLSFHLSTKTAKYSEVLASMNYKCNKTSYKKFDKTWHLRGLGMHYLGCLNGNIIPLHSCIISFHFLAATTRNINCIISLHYSLLSLKLYYWFWICIVLYYYYYIMHYFCNALCPTLFISVFKIRVYKTLWSKI